MWKFFVFLAFVLVFMLGATAYLDAQLVPDNLFSKRVSLVLRCFVWSFFLLLWLVFFIRMPIASQAFRKKAAFLSYFALGAFWIFLSCTLAIHLLHGCFLFLFWAQERALGHLALVGPGWIQEIEAALHFPWTIVVWGLAPLAIAAAILSARGKPRIRTVHVPIPDLAPALHGFTIVQLTDLHIGYTTNENQIRRIVEQANAARGDLVAITGDLVDGSPARLKTIVAILSDIQSTLGTFFVTGNHEYYAGAENWVSVLRELGMGVLLNAHVVIHHRDAAFVLGGVTDHSAGNILPHHASNPQKAFANAPAGLPRILLAHQPRSIFAAQPEGIALQLSGHTHGGQIFPFHFIVRLQQPFVAGLARFKKSWIYVSRGAGYWGPPMRLFAPAEISRIILQNASPEN